MEIHGIGTCKTMRAFVKQQMSKLKVSEETFKSVYEIMFSMADNIMFETTDGNKIYEYTYGQVNENVLKTAYSLKSKIDAPYGSIIGMYMDNSVEWVEVFWAILKCGNVPLLMNKRLEGDVLESILKDNEVRAVITDSKEFSVNTINYKDIDKDTPACTLGQWADKIILMSSGSSNNVKLCVYNGKAICEQIYNSQSIVERSKLIHAHYEGRLKQLTFLPFYHVFGLVACFMWFAFFSRTFVLLNNLSGETIINTVKKHKVTHIFAVPMLWERMRKSANKLMAQRRPELVEKFRKGLNLSNSLQKNSPALGRCFAKRTFKEIRENLFGNSIQFLISGGGAVTTKTLSFFNGIGYRMANGYGMTEIGITCVELSDSTKYLNSGSVGKPFGSVKCRVNSEGILEIQSKSIASEIITKDGTTKYTENDWFCTQDGAKIEKGHVYILGRSDDLIVGASGENISPSMIEDKFSIPDTNVCMLAVEKKGKIKSTLLISVNRYFSKQKIAGIKAEVFKTIEKNGYVSLIDDVNFTFEPLMTDSEFKLNRNKIRQRIASEEMKLIYPEEFEDEEREENINEELRAKVKALFEEVLEKELSESQYTHNFFFELGGTSLSYFQLVENIKEDFNVPFPIVEDQSIATINDFCLYLQDRL
ncbi:MAG: non-ribosomal peptide synthetase [Clostridia bacterium]|nr:non-ribosomal peptide synthetase [Clostridia bacterium]